MTEIHKSNSSLFFFSGYEVDSVHETLEPLYSPTCPGLPRKRHLVWKPILPTNHTQSCMQILGESFEVEMLHQKAEFLTGLRSLEGMVVCKMLILKASQTLIPVGG